MQDFKKTVGKPSEVSPLERVYQLNLFIKKLNKKINTEPNVKPIRKIVGRPHKG
ncbi:hypothetical protein K1X76_07380 [bacterium]|nr:hypothetical protein [bacterium]